MYLDHHTQKTNKLQRLEDVFARCAFHSSSHNEEFSGDGSSDRETKMTARCVALQTSFSTLLTASLAIGATFFYILRKRFMTETIGTLGVTWVATVSKASRTALSFNVGVSMERIAFLSDHWTNAIMWSSSKFSLIPIKDFLVNCVTRPSNLSVSWCIAFSIKSQTCDQFSGPSIYGSKATRSTVRLTWSVSILSDTFPSNLEISSPQSNVLCLPLVERSSSILDRTRAIALRFSRSGSSTGATSCSSALAFLSSSQNSNDTQLPVTHKSNEFQILSQETNL